MKKLLASFLICLLFLSINSCARKPKPLNRELFGQWHSTDNCYLNLNGEKNQIYIIEFSNAHGDTFKDVELSWKRNGIMTELHSVDKNIDFHATYVEGVLTIGKYCQTPLSKFATKNKQ